MNISFDKLLYYRYLSLKGEKNIDIYIYIYIYIYEYYERNRDEYQPSKDRLFFGMRRSILIKKKKLFRSR